MSEPSNPCTPPSAFPNGRFASTTVVAGRSTLPTCQRSTRIVCTLVTSVIPATWWLAPVVCTLSSFATPESTSDCDAPVSSANVYGPLPLIVTGTRAITCLPCLSTLIATFSVPSALRNGTTDCFDPPQPAVSAAATASVTRRAFTPC